jgi:multiple sugar transport system permease protein
MSTAMESVQSANFAVAKKRWWQSPGRTSVYVMLTLLIVISVVPLLNVIRTATSPSVGFYSHATEVLPHHPTLLNFQRALGLMSNERAIALGGSGADFNFVRALLNSLLFVVTAGVGQIFFSTLAAYAFARMHFPGRNFIFVAMLAALMVPGIVLFIPNFILMKDLHWLNTYQGMIAPYFLMTPFAVFFMRQFFLSIPAELEESARIDGASPFTIFRKIVVPVSRGPLATLAILTTINLWNEFFWPFLVSKDGKHYPLTVALQAFRSQQPQGGIDWTGLMSGTALAVIPVLVVVVTLGRKVVESLQFSGSK